MTGVSAASVESVTNSVTTRSSVVGVFRRTVPVICAPSATVPALRFKVSALTVASVTSTTSACESYPTATAVIMAACRVIASGEATEFTGTVTETCPAGIVTVG